MIAVDSSTWIAFLQGDAGHDTALLDAALRFRQVMMAPAVLTELLSTLKRPLTLASAFSDVPLLEPSIGYWQRAGQTRAKVIVTGRKARLGDALIAQSCIDHGIPLLTRDGDFRNFAMVEKLELVGL